MFGSPGGMGTNGGCRCLEHIIPREARADRVRVRANISKLRSRVAELVVASQRVIDAFARYEVEAIELQELAGIIDALPAKREEPSK